MSEDFRGHRLWYQVQQVVRASCTNVSGESFVVLSAGAPGLGQRMSLDLGQTMNMRNFKELGQVCWCIHVMAEASFLLIGLPACLKRPTGRLAAAADEGHAVVCLKYTRT